MTVVILPCSRHLPVAVVDGSLTENFHEIGVRLWTDPSEAYSMPLRTTNDPKPP